MLAFSIDYYGIFFWATQFVELFCTYFEIVDIVPDDSDMLSVLQQKLIIGRK